MTRTELEKQISLAKDRYANYTRYLLEESRMIADLEAKLEQFNRRLVWYGRWSGFPIEHTDKISAIKLVRALSGMDTGLRDAKELVESTHEQLLCTTEQLRRFLEDPLNLYRQSMRSYEEPQRFPDYMQLIGYFARCGYEVRAE